MNCRKKKQQRQSEIRLASWRLLDGDVIAPRDDDNILAVVHALVARVNQLHERLGAVELRLIYDKEKELREVPLATIEEGE